MHKYIKAKYIEWDQVNDTLGHRCCNKENKTKQKSHMKLLILHNSGFYASIGG